MWGRSRPDQSERMRANRGKTFEERFGPERAAEIRHNMSLQRKGKKPWNLNMTGRKHTQEAKDKIGAAHRGLHPTEEMKKHLSEATKRYWKEHPEWAKMVSEENKKPRHHWNAGKRYKLEDICTPEMVIATKRKLSLINKGNQKAVGQPPHKWGRIHPQVTMKGHSVRSGWEKMVCDWLFRRGIEYQYEPRHFRLSDENGAFTYTPDIYIPRWDVWWEVKGEWFPIGLRKAQAFALAHPDNYQIIDIENIKMFREGVL